MASKDNKNCMNPEPSASWVESQNTGSYLLLWVTSQTISSTMSLYGEILTRILPNITHVTHKQINTKLLDKF